MMPHMTTQPPAADAPVDCPVDNPACATATPPTITPTCAPSAADCTPLPPCAPGAADCTTQPADTITSPVVAVGLPPSPCGRDTACSVVVPRLPANDPTLPATGGSAVILLAAVACAGIGAIIRATAKRPTQ